MPRERNELGVSPVVGVVLLVAVTVLLALIILALFSLPHLCTPFPPKQIEIVVIHDYDEDRPLLNYDSRVLLNNIGTEDLLNRHLSARFYVDGVPIRNAISTFHGEDFIPTHHYGVELMRGEGCRGEKWLKNEYVLIDFKDGTFKPGQTIRVEMVNSNTGCIISRDEYRAPGPVR